MIGILLLDLKKIKKKEKKQNKKKCEEKKIKKEKNGKLWVDWKGFGNFSLPTCKQYDRCCMA